MLKSNYVIVLAAPDEQALYSLIDDAELEGIVSYAFHESDLGHTLTAVALQPGEVARKVCANLSLAGREVSNV